MQILANYISYPTSGEEGKSKNDFILLHRKNASWIKINRSAFEIAECIKNCQSLEKTIAYLVDKYSIPYLQAQKDVEDTYHQLREHLFFSETKIRLPLRKPRIQSLFLHLTNRCNLSCAHCYVAPFGKNIKDLPLETVKDMIRQLVSKGGSRVTFSGGEPILYPWLKEAVDYCQELGVEIRFLTNGTLIDEGWVDYFKNKDIKIQISLDGSKPEIHDRIRGRGSYAKAIRGAHLLKSSGLVDQLNFCTTVMMHNIPDLKNIISLTQEMGIPLARFLPLRKMGSAKKQWDNIAQIGIKEIERFYDDVAKLENEKASCVKISCGLSGFMLYIPEEFKNDEIWCPVGYMLVIDTDGDVYPCVLLRDEKYRLGNIFTNSLDDLENSEQMSEICENLSYRREKIGHCNRCHFKNLCQGGCMGLAMDQKGTILDTDNFCEYRKRIYRKAFDAILG